LCWFKQLLLTKNSGFQEIAIDKDLSNQAKPIYYSAKTSTHVNTLVCFLWVATFVAWLGAW
jgi:hypothetical protein